MSEYEEEKQEPTPQSDSTESVKKAQVEMGQDPVTPDEKPANPSPQALAMEILTLATEDAAGLEKQVEDYPNLNVASGEFGKTWLEAFEQAREHVMRGNVFTATTQRDASLWRQKVALGDDDIGAGRPRFGGSGGQVLSGERALMKATSVLGLGGVVQIPLWHTGIWVSLKAPSEASLLELERRIANEKISLGRLTNGMIFSNTSIYTVSYVVNFALNHIYDASVRDISQDALKNLIKVTDIPTLIWGLVCTIYPGGYKYARPCTANPSECQHVVTGKINLTKLSWTDNSSLSDWQRRHMSQRNEKFSEEDLSRYQKEHVRGGLETLKVSDELKVKLRVPTIAQYEQSGFSWVDNIVKMMEGSLGVSLKGQERDNYITDQGRMTALRQYGHWVESIEVGEDVIEDHESVEVVLGALSSEEEIFRPFFEGVGKYIDRATLSLIAVPKYRCPKCNGEQEGDVPQNLNTHLLPLDMCKIFFTLLGQRLYKALSKAML